MLWLEAMGRSRWPDRTSLLKSRNSDRDSANEIWWSLQPDDWLEAFHSHPKIGEKKAAAPVSEQSQPVVRTEQAGVSNASRETVDSLADAESRLRRKVWLHLHHLRHRQDLRRDARSPARTARKRSCRPNSQLPPPNRQNYRAEAKKIDQFVVVRGQLSGTLSSPRHEHHLNPHTRHFARRAGEWRGGLSGNAEHGRELDRVESCLDRRRRARETVLPGRPAGVQRHLSAGF